MRSIAIIGILAVTAACASAADPASTPFGGPAQIGGSPAAGSGRVTISGGNTPSKTIQATPERVWAALPGVYQQLGITPGFVDTRSHTLGNNDWELRRRIGGRPNSAYLNCGTSLVGAAADLHRVRITIRTAVIAAGEAGSEIATTIEGSATARDGGSDPTRCGSTGVLEERIATLLTEATR